MQMRLLYLKHLRAEEKYKQREENSMLFRRKGKLRKEFDEKLLVQFHDMKQNWLKEKSILEKSFDPSDEVLCAAKLTEAKYFFLFKEAKERNISLMK